MSTMMPAAELDQRVSIDRLPLGSVLKDEARVSLRGHPFGKVAQAAGRNGANVRDAKVRRRSKSGRAQFAAMVAVVLAVVGVLFYGASVALDDTMLGAIFAFVIVLPILAPTVAVMSQEG